MAHENIPFTEICSDLTKAETLSCDKRLFSLINRALNIGGFRADVKHIAQHHVEFTVIPLETLFEAISRVMSPK